jgi:hypothetical protein
MPRKGCQLARFTHIYAVSPDTGSFILKPFRDGRGQRRLQEIRLFTGTRSQTAPQSIFQQQLLLCIRAQETARSASFAPYMVRHRSEQRLHERLARPRQAAAGKPKAEV